MIKSTQTLYKTRCGKSIDKKLFAKLWVEKMLKKHETEPNKNYQEWMGK